MSTSKTIIVTKKTLRSFIHLILIFFFIIGIAAQASLAAETQKPNFYCGGCKTEFYLIQALFEAFGAEGRVLSIGNKKAINLMLKNRIDFAFTCKPIELLSKKLKLDEKAISSWESIPIAIDPLVVISNFYNGINDMTKEQLTAIFSGKITNWKSIGGKDLNITPLYLDPKTESGVLPLFKEFTVGINGAFSDNAKDLNSPAALGRMVSKLPGTVTFMGLNSYQASFGEIIKINGMMPDKETIITGDYPLSVTYYLTVSDKRSQDVSDFIQFCFSEAGQKIISKNYLPYSARL